MTSENFQALLRVALFICSVTTAIAALLALAAVVKPFLCVFFFGLMWVLLSLLGWLESLEGKQKAPGRAARPGA